MKNLKDLHKTHKPSIWKRRTLFIGAVVVGLFYWDHLVLAAEDYAPVEQVLSQELELTSADLDAGMEAIEQELALKSDEQLVQEIHALADSFRSAADEPSLTLEQKHVLLHTSEVLRTQANDPVQKPRQQILQLWKNSFDGLKKVAGYFIRGGAYASIAINQTALMPFRISYKFVRGLITGVAKPPKKIRRNEIESTSSSISDHSGMVFLLLGSSSTTYGILAGKISIAASWTSLALGSTIVLSNFLILEQFARYVCEVSSAKSKNIRLQRFCSNFGKIYRLTYRVSSIGDRGGAAIHNLFRKKKVVNP